MASRFRCPCGLAPEEQFAKPRAFDRPNEENALLAFCAMNPQFRTMVHRFVRRIPIEYGLIACEDAGSFDDYCGEEGVVVETEDGTMVWDDNVTRVSHEFFAAFYLVRKYWAFFESQKLIRIAKERMVVAKESMDMDVDSDLSSDSESTYEQQARFVKRTYYSMFLEDAHEMYHVLSPVCFVQVDAITLTIPDDDNAAADELAALMNPVSIAS